MWRLILGVVLTLLFANSTSADAIEVTKGNSAIQTQANKDGKVILDEVQSLDNNGYILNGVEPLQPALIEQTNATTFSMYDYADGFFDNPHVTWSGSIPPQFIDNDLKTVSKSGFSITFNQPIKLEKIYINAYGHYCTLTFSNGKSIAYQQDGVNVYSHNNDSLKSITCKYAYSNYNLRELELFVQQELEYVAASNLKVEAADTSATATFINPGSKYFVDNEILLDGKVIGSKNNQTSVDLTDLKADTNYELIVRSYYTDGVYVDAVKSFKTKKDTKSPSEVTNLTAKQVGNTVVLSWENPLDKDLSHVRITRNGMLKADKIKEETYTDDAPLLNTDTVYRVIAMDENGNFSSGASVTLKIVGTEVYSLQAKAPSHDKVDLIWKNPQHADFETVRIARKEPSGIMEKIASFFTGNDGYTDLFQTNGTIFNDLTVKADTQYTYKLSTVISGNESPGVTVNVKTPKLTASGGGVTVDPDDPKNYTITWNSPITGTMKILVGGKEYKTVPAADKKVVIPAADMKFDLIGKPDVKLVPISDEGKEGTPTSPGGGTSGGGGLGDIVGGGAVNAVLNGNNLLKAGVALLGVIGGFVLLGLAFRVVPKLIRTIRTAYGAKAERGMNR